MDEPELNKPHDFGGLISIVAVNIEGLPEIYQKILKYHRAHCCCCVLPLGTQKPTIKWVGVGLCVGFICPLIFHTCHASGQ
jgi:hypothetical protein